MWCHEVYFYIVKNLKKNIFFVLACFLCDSRVEMTRKYSQKFLIANCCTIGLLAQKESDSNSLFRPKTHRFTAFGRYLGFWPRRTDPVVDFSRFWLLFMCVNSVSNVCVMCAQTIHHNNGCVLCKLHREWHTTTTNTLTSALFHNITSQPTFSINNTSN